MSLTYTVVGHGEGVLCDDDDVFYMLSLACQMSLDRVEVNVKQREGVVPDVLSSVACLSNRAQLHDEVAFEIGQGSGNNYLQNAGTQLMSANWADLIKDVDQVFRGGAVEFRKALCMYSVETGFEFTYVKNERVCVTAECKHMTIKNCMWRIHASIEKANGYFYIKKFEKHHTCGSSFGSSRQNRMTSDIIAGMIVDLVRGKPDMVANDVIVEMKLNYGVDISYYVAWRSVTGGKQHVFGDDTSSYSHLPSYFEELGRTNPDSVYNLDIDADTMKFRRCFFAFGACLSGFKSFRPTLSLDGTFLHNKHKGILLTAIGQDGHNKLFPIAFAVVSEESDSNWAYFLTHLRLSIGTDRVVTIFSDRNHGILDGVKNIFPDCLHIYCLYHLHLNLSSKFRGCPSGFRKKIAHLLDACAYAPTKSEFDVHIKEFIETGGTRIRNFLADLPYNNWTCAHFEGKRYGQMASSVAESWNMKIGGIRGLPITSVVDGLRSIMMVQMCLRAEEAAVMSIILCTPIQGAVDKLVHDSRVLIAKRASQYIYEVLSTPTAVVDIRNRSCTCRVWQVDGLPCIHAACVLFHNNNDGYAYVDYHYTVECYKTTYSYSIYPFVKPNFDGDLPLVGPPDYHIRRGRPKVKRIPSRGEKIKRKIKCSSCNRMGNHNKKTCRKPV